MKIKLYSPLKKLSINQNFTEDRVCIKEDGTEDYIDRTQPTCPNGYVSIYKYFGIYTFTLFLNLIILKNVLYLGTKKK